MTIWHYQREASPDHSWNYYSLPFSSSLPGDHSENKPCVFDLNPSQSVRILGYSHFAKLNEMTNTFTLHIHHDANYFSRGCLRKRIVTQVWVIAEVPRARFMNKFINIFQLWGQSFGQDVVLLDPEPKDRKHQTFSISGAHKITNTASTVKPNIFFDHWHVYTYLFSALLSNFVKNYKLGKVLETLLDLLDRAFYTF